MGTPMGVTMSNTDTILRRLDGSMAAITSLRDHVGRIDALGTELISRLNHGGMLYTAGNGGSAAQAMHLAEELIGRYRGNRPALRAVARKHVGYLVAHDHGHREGSKRTWGKTGRWARWPW